MPEEEGVLERVWKRKEAGCERQEEYSAVMDGAIRRIGGPFWTRSLYARSLRGHVDIREPQRRARIRKEQMRREGSDREGWSAFWLAILGNAVDFLSIFFVCDSDSCILIKTPRVREKGQAILPLYLLSCSRAEKWTRANLSSIFHFLFHFPTRYLTSGGLGHSLTLGD